MTQLVRRALRQGERLSNLVDGLLDVSRLDAGRLPLQAAELDLVELSHEVAERFGLDLARSGCALNVTSTEPVVGRWDRSRLDQVITSLLANAIKFGAGAPIEIAVGRERDIAWLKVTDRGIGIEPSQQQHIFERFGRAASTRHYGGLGLGLYICREIVKAHGGSLRVKSELGAGATFTVELPCSGPGASAP